MSDVPQVANVEIIINRCTDRTENNDMSKSQINRNTHVFVLRSTEIIFKCLLLLLYMSQMTLASSSELVLNSTKRLLMSTRYFRISEVKLFVSELN